MNSIIIKKTIFLLPLIYINHNRHNIENYISNFLTKKNIHFLPYKFNYFLDSYYKKIKEITK